MVLPVGHELTEEQVELLEELRQMADLADHPLDFNFDRFKEIMDSFEADEDEEE